MNGTTAVHDTVVEIIKPRAPRFDPTWPLCLEYTTRRTCKNRFILTIICKTLNNLPRFILQMDLEISLNEFLNAGLNSAVSKNYVNL